MRITRLEGRRYRLPLDPPFAAAWDPVPRTGVEETIVIVHTDEGVRGYAGGTTAPDLDLLEGLLVGADPLDTERAFSVVETVDLHHGRNWTVEVALWDLVARVREKPLWEVLGGRRSSFRAYASTGERVPPEERVKRLVRWAEMGFGAAKLRFHHSDWRDDLRAVEAARAALGETMELMVDANQGWRMPGDLTPRWDLDTAGACAEALGDLDVYWLEEPLDTVRVEDYARLRETSPVRIAAGEMVRSLAETARLVEVVDVIQPDVVLAGGVTGCRRVAGWADRAGIAWSPHTWTTGLGLVANLHVALACSTAEFLELPFDPPGWTPERRDFMLPAPIEVAADGTVSPPEGPGLGVTPDLAALERWRVG